MDSVGKPLRHFLTLSDLTSDEAQALLQRAAELGHADLEGDPGSGR